MRNYRGLQKHREICEIRAWSGERKCRIGMYLTERSIFIVSLNTYKSMRASVFVLGEERKESALSEAGETFHEVARQGQ